MTGYKAEIIADSVSPDGVRLVSMLCVYPRIIHAEMLRHRVFSHSVASSRAIPTERLIEQVRHNPFVPETFNKRVKGMGVGEPLDEQLQDFCARDWREAANHAAYRAEALLGRDVDKSRVNRILEPYLWITDLITSTEWSNFFALREHPDAQPEFQEIARMMRKVIDESTPFKLDYGEWHMPLLTSEEYSEALIEGNATKHWGDWKMISAGRCARVSYDKQYEEEDCERSRTRAYGLIDSGHMSPFEHVARPLEVDDYNNRKIDKKIYTQVSKELVDPSIDFVGNLRGWVSMRKEISNEDDFSKIIAERAIPEIKMDVLDTSRSRPSI